MTNNLIDDIDKSSNLKFNCSRGGGAKSFISKLFSIVDDNKKHKVLNVLGIKVKFKRKFNYRDYICEHSYLFKVTKESHEFNNVQGYEYEKDFDAFVKYFYERYKKTNKPSIFGLEHKVTTRCTLRCKDCCHYAPFFKSHIEPVSFQKIKDELDLLLKKVDLIHTYSLIGGETLLSKDLPKMIQYAITKDQILNIAITTNCTIIPDADLINVLRNQTKCMLVLSDYRGNKDLSERIKLDEIVDICKKNNINYRVTEETTKWEKAPDILKKKKRANKTYTLDCRIYQCHEYAQGILYLCPLVLYMHLNTPQKKLNDAMLDIFKTDSRKIAKFLTTTRFDTCNYCNLNNGIEVPVALQLNKIND